MQSRILIFGKNGQVASNLVKLFDQESGFDVSSYSRTDIDFGDLEVLANFLNNLEKIPDFIINCAAYTNVDKAEDEKELADLINHQAVAVIAGYCAKNNVKLIHYSTDYVFDGSGNEPFDEDNTKNLNPLNHYGRTKLAAEKAIINSGCDYMILRLSWVWDQNPNARNFVNKIKELAKKQEILTIVDDQIGSPTNANFVAQNTIKIIKKIISSGKFEKGIYHITDGVYVSWYEFAMQIVDDLRKNNIELLVREIRPIRTFEYQCKAARPKNSRIKNNKLTF